ncbi:hypothetical protein AYI68_g8119 [Smittium mucronatum]|uniref:Uncharacterized protein n=1 Tax=Smittium mucronatum TaxID=133383 RepID=A0A1R0GLT8_9FUNG|nr:hypothetical protein AYI68_g8119 [Smittium mucronatum]
MKFATSGLLLISLFAASTFAQQEGDASVDSTSQNDLAEPNAQDGEYDNDDVVQKRDVRGRGRLGGRGYFNNGRYWYWDSQPDVVFINRLRYRPTYYYGQRFQYLYLYVPNFKYSWDRDIVFRRRWNRDAAFRRTWFGRVNYSKWRRN